MFTMPSGPVKCGGAPQKIAYLAADHWRKRVYWTRSAPSWCFRSRAMFKVPVFSRALTDRGRGTASRCG